MDPYKWVLGRVWMNGILPCEQLARRIVRCRKLIADGGIISTIALENSSSRNLDTSGVG
jgi:hypothetical protein